MMMECTDIEKYLDDYIDEAASLAEQQKVESHVDHCACCRQAVKDRKAILAALRSLPVAEASPEFEAKVFSAVRHHYGMGRGHSGHRFIAGFATAMAASLALWFASTLYTPPVDKFLRDEQVPLINLAINQTRTVKLVFESPSDMAEVTLSVALPENIELEGYAGQKQLVWQTNLNMGQNILALPIIATGKGQGELLAQLSYGDKTKQFNIVLRTADDGVFIYQTVKFKSTYQQEM
jgi:hypothetical protein